MKSVIKATGMIDFKDLLKFSRKMEHENKRLKLLLALCYRYITDTNCEVKPTIKKEIETLTNKFKHSQL